MPTKIAIVYHSGYGHTKRVAEAVAEGARGFTGANVSVLTADEATQDLDALDDADAIIFGSPTYMGGPAAQFKAFADATSKKWGKLLWRNKLAAGFTNSGTYSGDKFSTLQYMVTLAMQHGMVWVGLGELPASSKSGHGGRPDDVNRVGSYIGVMTQSDHAPPEETPAPGDLETARILGRRVAEAAARWARGAG